MHFAILCFDKPGVGELREKARVTHLDSLKKPASALYLGGPLENNEIGVEQRTPLPFRLPLLRRTFSPAAMVGLALAFAGGYMDGGSYWIAHSFTGHITGNMVLAALAIADSRYQSLGALFIALSCFLAFTYVGQVLRVRVSKREETVPLLMGLAAEMSLTALAPLPFVFHWRAATPLLLACLSAAMGLQNGVFSKTQGVSVHTTYLTGTVTTLVSLLAKKSSSSSGKEDPAAPLSAFVILRLWGCFILGAVCAGIVMPRFGARGFWCVEIPFWLALVVEGRLYAAINQSR